MANSEDNSPQRSLHAAELKKLHLEIKQLEQRSAPELEKLRSEISGLKASQAWDQWVGRFLPLATTMVAIAGFWFGIHQYSQSENERTAEINRSENNRLAEISRAEKDRSAEDRLQLGRDEETREKEFKKYFWEKQLDTYSEAVDLASQLANEQDPKLASGIYIKFIDLYHGKMVIYEDEKVMLAMKRFVEVYVEYKQNPGLQNDAKTSARELARECRNSLAKTWDIPLLTLDMRKF